MDHRQPSTMSRRRALSVTGSIAAIAGLGSAFSQPAVASESNGGPGYGEPGSDVQSIYEVPAAVWLAVARKAQAQGDSDGADLLRVMAKDVQGDTAAVPAYASSAGLASADGKVTVNVWLKLAKKALIRLLRYGSTKLPRRFRPIAGKIADVLESMENVQEYAIAMALQQMGVDSVLAWDAATWVVLFLGL